MKTKRILSILLAVVMVIALFPVTALANIGNEDEHSDYNLGNMIRITITAGAGGQIYSEGGQIGTDISVGGKHFKYKAVPSTGYVFDHWTYNGNEVNNAFLTSSTDPNLEVQFTKDGSIMNFRDYKAQAVFRQLPQYTLTVNKVGQGTVTPGTSTYSEGTVVTLTANPASGYEFTGWSGDASGTGTTTTVTMNSAKTVTATFTQIPRYSLTATASEGGTVAKNPNAADYLRGTSVTLTATPNSADYEFTGWSGDASGTTNPLVVTMDSNKTIKANFAAIPRYTLSISTIGNGTVTKSSNAADYLRGTHVDITAVPAEGWLFSGWSGDASGGDITKNVVMNSNKTITATFTALPTYALTTNVSPAGSGTVTKNPDWASYYQGKSVSLTASAAAGYRFGSWSGDASGTSTTAAVTMNGAKTVTANFIKTYVVTLNVDGPGHLDHPNNVAGTRDVNTALNLNDAGPEADAFCKFVGWRNSSGQFLSGTNITVTGDCTYTAVFGETNRLNLAVGPNGDLGNWGLAGHYGEGTPINLNDALPTGKTGYTLDCWKEYGWLWSGDGVVVPLVGGKPMITIGESNYFKAFFKVADYSLTYNLNNGTLATPNPASYTYFSAAITLNNPTRTGYIFAGWTGPGITVPTTHAVIPAGSTGDRTYIANWTPITYTVIYNENGGTGTMASSSHTYDVEKALTANAFTKDGCTFAGWTCNSTSYSNGQLVKNLTDVNNGTVTMYAQWNVSGVTVSGYNEEYDGAYHGVTVTGAAGATVTYSVGDQSNFGPTAPTYKDVTAASGVTVYVKVARTGATPYVTSAVIKITKKAASLEADDLGKVYGESDPSLAVAVSGVVGSETLSYSLSRVPGENVGDYEIIVTLGTGAVNDNYTITTKNGTFTISPAAATIKANDKSKTYGETDPALDATVTGAVGTETLDYTLSRVSGDNAGNYEIIVTLGSGVVNDNYSITTNNGTLTINKKDATITANDKSKTYGDMDPTLDAAVTGTVGAETLDYSLSRVPGENVGDYEIIVTLGLGAVNDNYNIATNDGTLTINPKAATITANDKSKTYGELDPALDATVTGTIEATLDYTLSRVPGENAGDYEIIVTLGSGAVNDNYSITTNNGTLTINKKAATITPNNKSKVYGETDPVLDATVTGVLEGETLNYSLSRDPGENAGDYDINVALGNSQVNKVLGGGGVNNNYAISLGTGTLTINKAPLTVTADDKAVTFLDAAPAYTAKYSGFVSGDDTADLGGTLGFDCTYASGSAVGTYDITPKGLTSGNYNITFAKGKLTVNTLMLTVSFVDYNGTPLGSSTVAYGTPATAPANPTREGYTFTGWSASYNNVTSSITVTAQYAINQYTVRFFAADGVTQIGAAQTVNFDGAAAFPTAPARTGYAFDRWVLTGDNAVYADSLTHVKENINAVATYLRNGYTVTFVDYDGAVIGTDGVLYGQGAEAPVPPTRAGYTFTGWDRSFDPVTGNITVTAQYTINRYTVTFTDFNGNVLDTQTVDYNTGATAPADPTRDGYEFTGWDTTFDAVTSDITVTAQYTQVVPVATEQVPQTGTNIPDEPTPTTGAAGFAWWWILVIVLGAGLLFFLIFFVWKRRRNEEEEQ